MPTTARPEAIRTQGEALRLALNRARARVLAEIQACPPAIPACDEHFNLLLERRDALGRELGRLDDVLAARISDDEKARRLADLRRDSTFFQPDARGA